MSNPRLGAGASYQLHFVSTKGWAVIPFGTRITARIYLGQQLIKTLEINEFEISLTGKRVTLFGDEDF
ncbi:MAG: hypothetical protein IJC16_04150 [Rikenellaceae bacterium]|nr:hypothetical protein [Rikenellaceae bacterium]